MTMQHIARSFKVSLFVEHPSIDPAEISRAIGLIPKRTTRAGAPRTTPAGEPLIGDYQFSCWSHDFDVQEAAELCRALEKLVDDLQCHRPFFHRIVGGKGDAALFVPVCVAYGMLSRMPRRRPHRTRQKTKNGKHKEMRPLFSLTKLVIRVEDQRQVAFWRTLLQPLTIDTNVEVVP